MKHILALTSYERKILLCGLVFLLIGGVVRMRRGLLYYESMKEVSSVQIVKIDINSASLKELKQLPFIGEKIAKEIINYRTKNGRIQSLEELKKIKGIGEKKISLLAGYISFGQGKRNK